SPDIEVLDIVLQGRTLVLSDIHIGLPHSRVRDAERLIVKLRPDNIVFLGDIIDFDNRQYPNENTAIFEAINIVNPRVFAGVRGEAEDTRRLYSVLDNAVGIGFESNYQAPYLLGFITLYKYYRVIKPQLTAYLPDNTRAVFIHGHQIKGPHTVKWLRKELGVEWIFHGHTHRFHIDNREKIVNTGCWLEEEWERKFNNRVVDSGKAVLIEKDGALTEIDYTDYL
ncbi:MAG: metallophosphoesterase family protein, partial [Thermoproteales archaeon]|nr:metallophosphoesterase family protein [Thermoproteales archaeon]